MSRADLAKALEVNVSYIGHLETGIRDPSFKTLTRLATALGWSLRFAPVKRAK